MILAEIVTQYPDLGGKTFVTGNQDYGEGNEAVCNLVISQIGMPYIVGGDKLEEGGFDCSGLVVWAFKEAGYDWGGERCTANRFSQIGKEISKEELVDFVRDHQKETCLFLEDSLIEMKKILSSEKEWSVLFYNQILLQEYTLQELMGFAYDYIAKEDYSIDSIAAKVLWEKIDEIVKFHGKESSLSYVMQLIKATLQHAEARRNNILLEMVAQGKIQKENQLVILPEDILENVIKPGEIINVSIKITNDSEYTVTLILDAKGGFENRPIDEIDTDWILIK